MTAILDWLGGKLVGPLATVAALLLGAGLLWQSGRIDGWPLIGGGFKIQLAALQQQIAARDLADAKTQAAALVARQKIVDAGHAEARAAALESQARDIQIKTILQKVPAYVSVQDNRGCVLPWNAIRLLDAAASGAGLDDVASRIAPGQPGDAASDVTLSEAVALLAADLGIARSNAGQLTHLENSLAPPP